MSAATRPFSAPRAERAPDGVVAAEEARFDAPRKGWTTCETSMTEKICAAVWVPRRLVPHWGSRQRYVVRKHRDGLAGNERCAARFRGPSARASTAGYPVLRPLVNPVDPKRCQLGRARVDCLWVALSWVFISAASCAPYSRRRGRGPCARRTCFPRGRAYEFAHRPVSPPRSASGR
jgi:hypothetical protein